ncbi:MAG: leucine-rich repeat domain-containing protein [Phycisphaeraceae bacterium]|nr:leucine-rich repeat domain-containing protein [Phycisphaeraceae bacterium]
MKRIPYARLATLTITAFSMVLFLALTGQGAQNDSSHYRFAVSDEDGSVTITGYRGPGGAITIPTTLDGRPVTTIARRAFMGNRNITSVTISDTITYIGREAFRDCRELTTVHLSSSVTRIARPAFSRNPKLENIHVAEDNPAFRSVDGVLFTKDMTAIRRYPHARAGDYVIPDTVTVIMDEAFRFCRQLTGVTIPDGVTFIGKQAFRGCDRLTEITLPKSLTTLTHRAFKDCINLKSIVIPDGVTVIQRRTFRGCVNLESVTLNDSVTTIQGHAFYGCQSLESITLPASVTMLGCGRESEVFAGCESLSRVVFLGDAPSLSRPGIFTPKDPPRTTVYRMESANGWPEPGRKWEGVPTAIATPEGS